MLNTSASYPPARAGVERPASRLLTAINGLAVKPPSGWFSDDSSPTSSFRSRGSVSGIDLLIGDSPASSHGNLRVWVANPSAPEVVHGMQDMLNGAWRAGLAPQGYDADEWRTIMCSTSQEWPLPAFEMAPAIRAQGMIRALSNVSRASQALVVWAQKGRLEAWMVEVIHERILHLAQALETESLGVLRAGADLLQNNGGAPPPNYEDDVKKVPSAALLVKDAFKHVYRLMAAGDMKSNAAMQAVWEANNAISGLVSLGYRLCSSLLIDWLFLFRKHLTPDDAADWEGLLLAHTEKQGHSFMWQSFTATFIHVLYLSKAEAARWLEHARKGAFFYGMLAPDVVKKAAASFQCPLDEVVMGSRRSAKKTLCFFGSPNTVNDDGDIIW